MGDICGSRVSQMPSNRRREWLRRSLVRDADDACHLDAATHQQYRRNRLHPQGLQGFVVEVIDVNRDKSYVWKRCAQANELRVEAYAGLTPRGSDVDTRAWGRDDGGPQRGGIRRDRRRRGGGPQRGARAAPTLPGSALGAHIAPERPHGGRSVRLARLRLDDGARCRCRPPRRRDRVLRHGSPPREARRRLGTRRRARIRTGVFSNSASHRRKTPRGFRAPSARHLLPAHTSDGARVSLGLANASVVHAGASAIPLTGSPREPPTQAHRVRHGSPRLRLRHVSGRRRGSSSRTTRL